MKTGFLFFAILCVSSVFVQAQSITDGLQLYYKLDGSAVDSTTNGFDGAVNGPIAVPDEASNPNSAYYFDGVDDFIDLPNDPLLKPALPFSYSMKVYFETVDQVDTYIFTSDFFENNYYGAWANLTADGLARISISFSAGLGNTGPGNRRTKSSDKTLLAQQWYTLTFVVRGATDMDIYMDCVNEAGDYHGSGATEVAYSSVPGSLGRRDAHTGNPPYYFNGKMDNFAFWDRALSEAEVISLCDNVTGLENQLAAAARNILIYPNPVAQTSIVEFGNPNHQSCKVRILDLQGRAVFLTSTRSNRVVMSEVGKLGQGVYICEVFNEVEMRSLGVSRLVVQ